jgi:hypothetical protein
MKVRLSSKDCKGREKDGRAINVKRKEIFTLINQK